MANEAIAGMLRSIADLLDYQGVAFKPAAYRRAAQTLEDLSYDAASVKDKKVLLELPGIGEAIAEKILEFGKTGSVSFLERLKAETQTGAAGLLAVDDLGPRRVRQLEQALNIRTVAELIDAAEKGKIQKLPGFSELLERKILENAKRAPERSRRFPHDVAAKDVAVLLKLLRKFPDVSEAEAAGSFRRQKETVGDVDILIAVENPSETLAQDIERDIKALSIVERVVAAGGTRIAFDLKTGLRVDIRIVAPEEWGSALLYFTGSKEHNISLRRRAIERDLKLSEYGLFKGKKVVASVSEKDIYKALNLPFIEPQNRTADLPS